MHDLNFIPGSKPYNEAMSLRDPAFVVPGSEGDSQEGEKTGEPAKETEKEPTGGLSVYLLRAIIIEYKNR